VFEAWESVAALKHPSHGRRLRNCWDALGELDENFSWPGDQEFEKREAEQALEREKRRKRKEPAYCAEMQAKREELARKRAEKEAKAAERRAEKERRYAEWLALQEEKRRKRVEEQERWWAAWNATQDAYHAQWGERGPITVADVVEKSNPDFKAAAYVMVEKSGNYYVTGVIEEAGLDEVKQHLHDQGYNFVEFVPGDDRVELRFLRRA